MSANQYNISNILRKFAAQLRNLEQETQQTKLEKCACVSRALVALTLLNKKIRG